MPNPAFVSVKNRTTVRFDALQLGALRSGVQVASRLAPGWLEAEAARLFLTPRRPANCPEPQLAGGVRPLRRQMASGPYRLSFYIWGRGEPVLLVHGWEGRASQLTPFAERIVGETRHTEPFLLFRPELRENRIIRISLGDSFDKLPRYAQRERLSDRKRLGDLWGGKREHRTQFGGVGNEGRLGHRASGGEGGVCDSFDVLF